MKVKRKKKGSKRCIKEEEKEEENLFIQRLFLGDVRKIAYHSRKSLVKY